MHECVGQDVPRIQTKDRTETEYDGRTGRQTETRTYAFKEASLGYQEAEIT